MDWFVIQQLLTNTEGICFRKGLGYAYGKKLVKKETQTKDSKEKKNQVLRGNSLVHHNRKEEEFQVQILVNRQIRGQDAEKVLI